MLLLSPEGSLTVTDSDLNIQKTLPAANDEDRLLRVFEYPRSKCSDLLPFSVDSTGLVLVLAIKRGAAAFLRLLSVEDEGITDFGTAEIFSAKVSCLAFSEFSWPNYNFRTR
jgi:hypothetical protein